MARARKTPIVALLYVAALFFSGTASAGTIYNFATQLELDTGPDTDRLDGATMSFSAQFADDAMWFIDPVFTFQAATPDSHLWTISGGSDVDGDYTSTNGAQFTLTSWSGVDDLTYLFMGIANFDGFTLVENCCSGSAGTLVKPRDFMATFPDEGSLPNPALAFWQTSDGSSYNWTRNASAIVFDSSTVPSPSALWLLVAGLFGLAVSRLLSEGGCVQPRKARSTRLRLTT